MVLSPTSAPASRWMVASPLATPVASAAVLTGASLVALAISRNHMPNSGPLVPPVFRKPLATAKNTSAKVRGSSRSRKS